MEQFVIRIKSVLEGGTGLFTVESINVHEPPQGALPVKARALARAVAVIHLRVLLNKIAILPPSVFMPIR
jgi:hypothetical protein